MFAQGTFPGNLSDIVVEVKGDLLADRQKHRLIEIFDVAIVRKRGEGRVCAEGAKVLAKRVGEVECFVEGCGGCEEPVD